jgi:hypothetical protein
MNRPDYRHWRKDHASVVPAIQSSITSYSGRAEVVDIVKKHSFTSIDAFNYLNHKGLYLYDIGLYSAGNAELDIEQSKKTCPTIWDRREDTILISDSGGFQLIGGHFTPREYYENRRKILAWQEEISDIAIAMDVPTGCITSPRARCIDSFEECLEWTKANFTWQVQNRNPDKAKMLNVIQGNGFDSPNGALRWYDGVKSFCDRDQWGENAFDGWSFAGRACREPHTALKLILRMIDDGLLGPENNHLWIHFLGATATKLIAKYTLMQRALQEVLKDDRFTISCDSSNPYYSVGRLGQFYADDNKKITPRKVLSSGWLALPCGKDCATKFDLSEDQCIDCETKYRYSLLGLFGTSTLGHYVNPDMIVDMVEFNSPKGRLSPFGYLSMTFISTEMFLRHVYRRSNKIVEANTGLVDQIVDAFRCETPETALEKIKFP